jgi:hypothetical protein
MHNNDITRPSVFTESAWWANSVFQGHARVRATTTCAASLYLAKAALLSRARIRACARVRREPRALLVQTICGEGL